MDAEHQRLVLGSLRRAWESLVWIRERWRKLFVPILSFEVWWGLLTAVVFVPLVAWSTNRLIASSGAAAIGNTEMIGFFSSIVGVTFLLLAAGSAVTLQFAEYAGRLVILESCMRDPDAVVGGGVWRNLSDLPRLFVLGVIQTGAYMLGVLAWIGGLAFIKATWLGVYDINFYLGEQPREWFFALGLAGAWTVPWALGAIALGVRWIHAVPMVVFEQATVLEALTESWRRSRGTVIRWVIVLLAWGMLVATAFLMLAAAIRWPAARILGESLGSLHWTLVVVGIALGTIGLLGAVALVFWKLGLALLVLGAYQTAMPAGRKRELRQTPGWLDRLRPGNIRVGAWILVMVLAAVATLGAVGFLQDLAIGDPPKVTAHRGSSHAAPENTRSAIRQAIEDGADYAEIDVQTTADGVVVLLHDADLRRMAGDGRRLRDLTLEQVRSLDVGRWFSPDFEGERVPTLEEVITVSRGRLKLNIELKYNWPDPDLGRKVGEILRRESFVDQSIVMSLDWSPLNAFHEAYPEIRIGYIVFRALGRLAAKSGDAFSMNAAQVTRSLVGSVQRRGAEVHVWTVNDTGSALSMLEMGVDNIISDRPADLRVLVDEWKELSDSERVTLTLRRLLFPDEELKFGQL